MPAVDGGQIVLAPPGAIADRWARSLPDPVVCIASGWMRVKQRAKQRGVEPPLVISDHADWDELLVTMQGVGAPEVWITHGREEALAHAAGLRGIGPGRWRWSVMTRVPECPCPLAPDQCQTEVRQISGYLKLSPSERKSLIPRHYSMDWHPLIYRGME